MRRIWIGFPPSPQLMTGHGVLHSCEVNILPLGTTRCDCAVSQAMREMGPETMAMTGRVEGKVLNHWIDSWFFIFQFFKDKIPQFFIPQHWGYDITRAFHLMEVGAKPQELHPEDFMIESPQKLDG